MRFLKPIYLLLIVAVAFSINISYAQPVAQAKAAMESLYKLYDSTDFITFDVRYNFFTDTAYGDFKSEAMAATYTMSGRKAKFSMDNIEYMQNDSFFITVYNKEKIIVVANSRMQNAGGYMPMRAIIDSVLNAYADHYLIAVTNDINNPDGSITFERADSLAMYDKFIIRFDTQQKYLTGLTYTFMEETAPETDDSSAAGAVDRMIMHRRTLRIDFLNYRFDNIDPEIYNENRYIWEDEGELKPVSKYEGYKVYNSR